MATEIDKRVVEMQFDNKDFEKNCQKSLSTLEKLKMALNLDGAAKGLTDVGKAADKVDLSNLSKSAETVEVKFNAMQIAGMTAIQELTRSLMNFGRNVWANTLGQIKTGGMARTLKIEQAMFQMKALAKNIKGVGEEQEKVNAFISQMKDAIDKSVTGTAYGYDSAAAVASQLMSSGLTDADKMYNHLRAIAGAAAMTGSSFEEIGHIFTTVASNGRVMGDQLMSFSVRGLNLASILAKSLNKSEAEMKDYISKGKVSFEEFSNALYEAFGDAAGKADDTFNGVTSNIKAQLSRIGQLFSDPFVENVIPFFKEVKARIKDVNVVLQPVAHTWSVFFKYVSGLATNFMKNLNVSKLRRFVNGIENILVALIEIIWTIGQAIKEVFPKQVQDEIDAGVAGFERFTRTLIPTKEALLSFKQIVKAILIPFKLMWTIGVAIVKYAIRPMLNIFVSLIRVIVKIGDAFKPIINSLLKLVTDGEFVSNIIMIIASTLVTLSSVLVTVLDCVVQLIAEITNSGTFSLFLDFLSTVAELLSTVILNALVFILGIVNKILSVLNSENIKAFFQTIVDALAFVLSVGLSIAENIGNFFKKMSEGDNIFADILNFVKGIAALIVSLFSGNDVEGKLNSLQTVLISMKGHIKELLDQLKAFFHEIDAGKIILYAFSITMLLLLLSVKNLIDTISGIATTIKKGLASLVGIASDIRTVLKGLIKVSPALQVLLGLTAVIIALALALKMLSEVPFDKLKNAGIVLGSLAVGLILLSAALLKISVANANAVIIAPILFALAGSVLLISVALRVLASTEIDLKKMTPALIAVTVLIAELTLAIIAMNATAKLMFPEEQRMGMSALAILAFAGAIGILTACVLALKDLKLEQAITSLITISGLLAGLAFAVSLVGKVGMTFGGGMGAIAFILSFVILLKSIQRLASFPFEAILAGLKNAGVVMIAISALYLAFVGISLLAGGNVFIQNMTRMLFALTAMIGVATLSIAALGSLDQNMIARGVSVITYLSILFAAVTKMLLKSFDKFSSNLKTFKDLNILKSFSRFLIAFSACLVILSAAAHIAAGVQPNGIGNMAALMLALTAACVAIERASAHTKRAKVGVIIAFILGVMAVLSAMVFLSYADPDGLMLSIAAVGIVMLGLALIGARFGSTAKELKNATGGESESKSNSALMIAFILGLMGILAALTMLVKYVDTKNADVLGITVGAVAIVLVTLGTLMGIMAYLSNKINDTKKLWSLAGSIIVLSLVFAVIGATIVTMAHFTNNIDTAGVVLISLGEILLGFAAVIGLFDWFLSGPMRDFKSSDLLKAASSIVILSSVIAIIGGVLTGMALIMSKDPVIAANGLVSFIELIGGFAIIMVAFKGFMKKVKDVNGNDILKAASSIVVLSSALLIIAGSITGMSLVMSKDPVIAASSVLALIELLGSFAIMILLFKDFILKTKGMDAKRLSKVAASIVILSSVLAIIAASISGMTLLTSDNNLSSLQSFGEIILSFVVIMKVFESFLTSTKGMDSKRMMTIATTIVILSSSLIIIAAAITAMGTIMSLNPDAAASMLASFALIIISFIVVVGALYLIQKKVSNTSKFLSVAGSIVLACSALLIIATAILMLKDVNVDSTFIPKMAVLIIPFIAIVGLMAIVASVGENMNPLALIAAGAAVVLGATAILLIAKSVSEIINATRNVDESKLGKVQSMIFQMEVLLIALAAIGGILGASGYGFAILGGVAAIMAAFLLFAAAVDILAGAVEKVVDCAIKLSNTTVDYNKVKNNFMNGIAGISDAISESIPKILTVVGILIAAIIAALNAKSFMAAATAMAYVMAFLTGLAACLPSILYMVGIIMQEVVDWLNQPGQMDLIKEFFEKVAEMLGDIILGTIHGLVASIIKELDAVIEYAESKKRKENHQEQVEIGQRKQVDQFLSYATKQAGFINYYDLVLNAEKVNDDVWQGLIDGFNRVSQAAKDNNEVLTEATIEKARFYLENAPAEMLANLDEAYGIMTDKVDNFTEEVVVANQELSSLPGSSNETFGTVTKDSEEATTSIEETTEAVKDFKEESSTAADGLAESTEQASINFDDFKKKFDGLGDGLKKSLGSIDLKSFAKKLGVDYKALGSVLGSVTGVSFGEDYEETLEYYMEDAMKKIYDPSGQWQYKWQTFKNEQGERIYSSAEQYANAMMDEAGGKTSFALTKLADFLGINLDIDDALKDVTGSLGDFGDTATDSADKANTKFKDFYTNLRDSIKNSLNIFDEVSEQEEISSEEMLDRMWENTRRVGQWARQISELAARGMSEGLLNELKDLGPQGAAKVDAFARMTQEQLMEANRLYADAAAMPDAASREIIQSYKDAGYDASLGFVNGIDTEIAKVKMEEMGEEGLDGLKTSLDSHSPSRETMKIGEFATEGFTIGMTDAKSQGLINKATHIIAALLMNGLKNDINPNKLRTVGENCMDGLVAGFNYKLPSVISRIQAIATQILSRFAQMFKINSPSKVFEEFGEMTMLGFSNGMDEGQSDVVSTTDKTANDILDAMKANIASITDGWSEDSAYEPVIRPVFDMSSISQGYSDIQTWFANAQGLNLNGNLSRLTPTTKDEDSNTNMMLLDAIKNLNNDDVVDELVALRNDISQLQSAMTNLQVVMNTGALVGQIVDPMDNALGAKALRNQRGRY